METNQVLEMIFMANDGNKVTVSVPFPKAGLTGAEVNTAMTEIIGADIFSDNHGSFVDKSGARTITKTTEEIALA
jgi:hypothetical protein